MGRQNKDVGCIGCFGWLLAVGLILYIIEVIFSFAIKNLPIIITVIFVALILFMLIALFRKKRKDLSDKEIFQDDSFINKPVENIQTESQNMKEFDVEAFARECNAYVIREERKERQKREQESSKIQSGIESFNNDIFETNQELDNIENDTLSKNEEWEKLNAELSDALRDYGNLYVNLFNERFYVNSSLINSRTIENNSTEFIIKCETLEQAKYVVMHENELNQNLKSTHKMTLLANNCISLIVIRK